MLNELDIAAWWKASVWRADTHVYWSAVSCIRLGASGHRFPEEPLFTDYVCALEMFLDLIKRHVVGEVIKTQKGEDPFFHESSWAEIKKTLDAGHKILLNDEGADEYDRKYRLPARHFSYELTIDSVDQERVSFDFAFLGYKYRLSGMKVNRNAFYDYADKLGAQVRFRTAWASIDEALSHLISALPSPALKPIRAEIQQVLSQLRDPRLTTYDPACAELLRLTEKLLREVRKGKGWRFKADNLDHLINGMSQSSPLSQDTIQMLRLVSKPYRDYILHGRTLTPMVAKTILATTMEAISRLGSELE